MPEARPYRRVLALIRLDGTDEHIARKALLLARLNRAELLLLHLIEPDAALDGGYPAAGARKEAAALEAGAVRRLGFLAAQLGAGEAECVALHGPARQTFRQAVKKWRPELVVSAQDFDFLSGAHDVLILGRNSRAQGGWLVGRFLNRLGAQLLPAGR
ncbi:MAG: universal stress protein [Pseudomonadota bacterium]